MENRNILIIDPTNMTDDEELILYYVLDEQSRKGNHYLDTEHLLFLPYWKIQDNSDINLNNFSQIKLTHALLNTKPYHHEVLGEEIGKGGFGKVYTVIGTLITSEKPHVTRKKSHLKVTKEMFHENEETLKKFCQQEYFMTKRDQDLGAKKPVFFSVKKPFVTEYHSCMVMKFIAGEDLQKIVVKDQINKKTENHFDTDTRIKMSIAVARALEKVLHNKIIHTDIKSGNIMMDMNSPNIKAKVLDFGGSRDKEDDLTTFFSFTHFFAAPEVYDGLMPSHASDVYSASWVFNEIWRGDNHPAQKMREKLDEKIKSSDKPVPFKDQRKKEKNIAKNLEKVSHHCEFKNLFVGIDDLDKRHKKEIKQLLKKKSDKYDINRGSFSEFTEVFERISLERLIDKIPSPEKSDTVNQQARENKIYELRMAHILGIQIRKKLEEFVDYNYSKITPDDLAKVKKLFADRDKGFMLLTDTPEVIALFLERLQVTAFMGLKTRQEIVDKLFGIIDSYNEAINTLVRLRIQNENLYYSVTTFAQEFQDAGIKFDSSSFLLELKKMEKEITDILEHKYQLTIDKLVSINLKFQTKIANYQTNLESKTAEIEKLREELKNASFLNGVIRSTNDYLSQFSLFKQASDKQDKPRHEVRLTLKNYG